MARGVGGGKGTWRAVVRESSRAGRCFGGLTEGVYFLGTPQIFKYTPLGF